MIIDWLLAAVAWGIRWMFFWIAVFLWLFLVHDTPNDSPHWKLFACFLAGTLGGFTFAEAKGWRN